MDFAKNNFNRQLNLKKIIELKKEKIIGVKNTYL